MKIQTNKGFYYRYGNTIKERKGTINTKVKTVWPSGDKEGDSLLLNLDGVYTSIHVSSSLNRTYKFYILFNMDEIFYSFKKGLEQT